MKKAQATRLSEPTWAKRAGYRAAVASTAAGVIYFLVLVGALVAGQMTWPPPAWLQLFGGVISLIMARCWC